MPPDQQKPIIFLAFANPKKDLDEDLEIKLFQELFNQEPKFDYKPIFGANATDIYDFFKNQQFRERICIFHYSGHATENGLLLNDKLTHGETLGNFLANQKGLQLVVLNACETQNLGEHIVEGGIPAVIATNQPVKDLKAARFTRNFYENLLSGNGNTIETSFQNAVLVLDSNPSSLSIVRGLDTGKKIPAGTEYLSLYNEEEDKNWKLTNALQNGIPQPLSTKLDANLRKAFLKNLKELYQKRLHDKMVGELNFEIKLNLTYTTQGTRPETIEDFYIIKDEGQAGDFDRLFKKYVNNLWRLLILGEPGAGKSILLLRFGLGLIEEAEKAPNFPVPVLLDLVTWKDKDQTFEHWLEMNLPYIGGSFAVSKKDAKELVESQNLLPLLDGFDEISSDYRDSCFDKLIPYLQKVKNSREGNYPEVIICSRILEYEAAEDAPVSASVKIQPLTKEEVEVVLKPLVERNFLGARRLQDFLQENPNVYAAISSAFFLHTLLNISQLARPTLQGDSKEALQKEITKTYIAIELDKINDYPKEKIKKWLGWLAWNMKFRNGSISFELIDLQPVWTRRMYVYYFVVGLIFGLITGGLGGGIAGETLGSGYGLRAGLITSLTGGLTGGLIFGWIVIENQIKTAEIKKNSLHKFNRRVLKANLISGLVYGLVLGLVYGVIYSLGYGLSSSLEESLDWYFLYSSLVLGMTIGIVYGLFFGLSGGFVLGLIGSFSVDVSFPRVLNPYKRFIAQFWRDLVQWSFVFSLLMGFVVYATDSSNYGFIVGLCTGCLISIFNSPIFRHICLRIVLKLEDVIPLRLGAFLDSVSRTGLLIKDGGQWRFRHQLILDSLANEFEENHPELLAKRKLEEVKKRRREKEMVAYGPPSTE